MIYNNKRQIVLFCCISHRFYNRLELVYIKFIVQLKGENECHS